jgi:hypothetical protein
MLEKIKENIFVFCEYMETMKPRGNDFLKKIIDFHSDLDENHFTMLFVRVCIIHRDEPLIVQPQMVKQAMILLVDAKSHTTAAFGLLKLTYENQIALTNFPRDLLLRF